MHAIRPEPHPPRAAKTDRALAHTKVGLGGLCWHTFEHNRTPEHKGIMEHNRKKHEHLTPSCDKHVIDRLYTHAQCVCEVRHDDVTVSYIPPR